MGQNIPRGWFDENEFTHSSRTVSKFNVQCIYLSCGLILEIERELSKTIAKYIRNKI